MMSRSNSLAVHLQDVTEKDMDTSGGAVGLLAVCLCCLFLLQLLPSRLCCCCGVRALIAATPIGHSFFNEDLQRYLPSSSTLHCVWWPTRRDLTFRALCVESAATVFSQAPGTGLRQLVPEVDVPRARHSSARKPEDRAQSGGSQVLEDRIARFAQSHPPVSKDMVPEPQNVEDSDDEDEKDAQSARQDEESSAGNG